MTPSIERLFKRRQQLIALIVFVVLVVIALLRLKEAPIERVARVRPLYFLLVFFSRTIFINELVRDETLSRHFKEHAAVKKIVLWVKPSHQIVQVLLICQDRNVLFLHRFPNRIFLSSDVLRGDHVTMEESNGASLSLQESSSVQEPRHSVHLNQVLDVLLLLKAFASDEELGVAVELAPAPAPFIPLAARGEARAEGLENGN